MRVLILAEDCNPEWASLPLVGYKAARAIANLVNVVVVTQIRNRPNIEKVGLGAAKVMYVDNEYVARPSFKFATLLRGGTTTGWTTAMALKYPSYLAFEREAWKATRKELQSGVFDLVHRLTPMSPTLPSPMASWSPVPFILGPLNGGLRWPVEFRGELAREREWMSYVRSAYRILPYCHSTYRRSAAILAAFHHTIEDLPGVARPKTVNFPEVGIDPALFDDVAQRPAHKRKTILTAGRLVPYKLHHVVVRAFASRPCLRTHRLIIAGDGPERPAIERLIHNLGIEDRVELTGWIGQSQLATLMRESDIFAFPSIRELGAGVVVEAMACGLACIVVDYGGPGALIDTERGIKVPLGDQETLTHSFGSALERLVADEEISIRLGSAARRHAMHFYSWEAKARKMLEVYEWVLGRAVRPSFWKENKSEGDAILRGGEGLTC